MNTNDKVELIDIKNKKRNIKMYKIFDLFIRSFLTIVGAVSLLSLLMFLNSRLGVSYFSCFVMTCIIPSVYSLLVNSSLKGLDKKIKNMKYELSDMENKYKKNNENIKNIEKIDDRLIEKIEFRFGGLSNEKKLELLNYIKNTIPNNNYSQYMIDIDNLESINLDDIVKEVYTRKRKK